jgi:hypothetical protein
VQDQPIKRYKALAHIIVGGRCLHEPDDVFDMAAQQGDALVRAGKAIPHPPRRYNRRDMRAEE